MNVKDITLTGKLVRLEPLAERHADDLYVASADPDIWTYMPRGPFTSVDDVRGWVAEARDEALDGTQHPLAIIMLGGGMAVGSTRYLDVRPRDRGLEIGWTWLSSGVPRTGVNTECKSLLLRHAFEKLDCARVQFKTDARNVRAQQALERIGAVREGVLRRHMLVRNGFLRDSVVYGITIDDWPAVRLTLSDLLQPPSP